jgi:hypothetical protein
MFMKLWDIVLEAYKDLKADKKKDPESLRQAGWVIIPKEIGRQMVNILHVTDEKGAEDVKEHLNEWQLSSFVKGKIGKVGNRVVVFNGLVNKVFIGDAGTVVCDDGFRWYHPGNIQPDADYDELVAIPNKIVAVIDTTDWGKVIYASDVYLKLRELGKL